MEIGGDSSLYTDYLQNQSTAETKLKETISGTDYSQASEDELLSACKQFEAYFLEQVFKEMEKTVDCFKADQGSNPNNNLVDYFGDNAIQEFASTSTELQGLGLAETLYEQMKRNYNL